MRKECTVAGFGAHHWASTVKDGSSASGGLSVRISPAHTVGYLDPRTRKLLGWSPSAASAQLRTGIARPELSTVDPCCRGGWRSTWRSGISAVGRSRASRASRILEGMARRSASSPKSAGRPTRDARPLVTATWRAGKAERCLRSITESPLTRHFKPLRRSRPPFAFARYGAG